MVALLVPGRAAALEMSGAAAGAMGGAEALVISVPIVRERGL